MARDPIRIDGLREFQAALRKVDRDLPKQLRLVLNDAAEVIVEGAKPLVPRRSGKAAASIKAQSQQRFARVKAGGARVPYYPWLDFGGSVGKRDSVKRPFLRDGRFLYPTLRNRRSMLNERMEKGLADLVRRSGLEVS